MPFFKNLVKKLFWHHKINQLFLSMQYYFVMYVYNYLLTRESCLSLFRVTNQPTTANVEYSRLFFKNSE